MKEQKKKKKKTDDPLSAHQKNYAPLSAHQKSHDPPPYSTAPPHVEIMNGPLVPLNFYCTFYG